MEYSYPNRHIRICILTSYYKLTASINGLITYRYTYNNYVIIQISNKRFPILHDYLPIINPNSELKERNIKHGSKFTIVMKRVIYTL